MSDCKIQKLQEICEKRAKDVGLWDHTIKVNATDDVIKIDVKCMYQLEDFITFAFLSEISELLDTKDINVGDEDYLPGCDTCDYGSVSEVTITIKGPYAPPR